MNPEEAFAKAFIRSEKRARFIQFLAHPVHRKELLARMSHDLPLLTDFATEVPGDQDYPAELEKLLKAKGAEASAHVIADGLRIDGRSLPLRAALDQICLHPAGAILCCLPGRLAYYKPESPRAGILLERPGR